MYAVCAFTGGACEGMKVRGEAEEYVNLQEQKIMKNCWQGRRYRVLMEIYESSGALFCLFMIFLIRLFFV